MNPQAESLAGQVAVVTGVNGLLGPVWAAALLDAGATVWGLDLRLEKPAPAVVALQKRHGGRFHLAQADVVSRASLDAAREQIRAGSGDATILINNAGIDQPPQPGIGWKVEEFPWDDFKRVVEVNLCGAFLASQVFGPDMVARRSGVIVNIGSLYASVSPDERNYDHLPSTPPFIKPPAYGASKAGLLNLTRYLAAHWGKHGIRVNMLSPGGIAGGQDPEFRRKFCARVPLGRLGEHAELGGPLLFLVSSASSYVTGENLKVDGGYTLW
jgi:NAD(P)-dependent dehydrogenase (short-subunit alcohol dehydrogenase family)